MKAKTNIKVMTKPELTDEEIQSHMDFHKLLQNYHQSRPARTISKWITLSGLSVVIIAIVSTATYFYTRNDSPSVGKSNPPQPTTGVDTTSTTSHHTAIPPQLTKKEEITQQPGVKKATPRPKKTQVTDTVIKENSPVQQFVEASPVDGYPSLYSYFDKELKYPAAPKDSMQGIVTVSFAITKAGKPDFIKIENSLGPLFDEECIRVIQHMPPWKPATMNGKPVQTRLSIPLTFKIKK